MGGAARGDYVYGGSRPVCGFISYLLDDAVACIDVRLDFFFGGVAILPRLRVASLLVKHPIQPWGGSDASTSDWGMVKEVTVSGVSIGQVDK